MLGFVPHHQPTMNGRLAVTKEPQHAHHRLIIIAFDLYMQVLKGRWSSCWGSCLTTNLQNGIGGDEGTPTCAPLAFIHSCAYAR